MNNPLAGLFALASLFISQAFDFSPESQVAWIREYKIDKGVHMIKINNAPDFDIQPYVSEKLVTAKEVFKNNKLKLAINAGYFDPNNEKTISYVIQNSEIVLDPTQNEALMENPELKPHLNKILNRGEFRILKCENKTEYDIAYHNEPIDEECKIIHSIQAGPILDEEMDLEKEYFVVTENGQLTRDSISATKKVARTAIGLKENDIYLFVVTNENPMTIEELNNLMKKKKMEQALAFDGGSSTSLEFGDTSITSANDETGRKVKSFFVIKK